MTEQEKMLSGQLYFAGGPELLAARKKAKELCQRFNQTAVQDPETISYMSALNAEIQGKPGTDPFYGAPTVVVVLGDGEKANWLQDGSLVMGNLMNAAAALGLGSCWINRARELFDRPEGRELLKKWGLPETYRGVGNCILGYVDGELPAPKPRKEGWIIRP